MIKESLFAAEEREAKLNKLGDTLQLGTSKNSTSWDNIPQPHFSF
jgi:hypothetical protein